MLTIFALALICLAGVAAVSVVVGVVLAIVGLPFMILFGLLPWLLRIAGVVLLFKALVEKPVRWENFIPAVIAFALSWLLGWL